MLAIKSENGIQLAKSLTFSKTKVIAHVILICKTQYLRDPLLCISNGDFGVGALLECVHTYPKQDQM